MKDYEVMIKELDENDWTLLRFNIDKNEYGPFESLVDKIKEFLTDSENRMSLVSKPSVITNDKADGMYLVNEDHLHPTIYMHKGESWFRLDI